MIPRNKSKDARARRMRPHVLWFETAGSRQPETDNVNRDGGAAQAYSGWAMATPQIGSV